jgi:hypothetical protein
MSVCSHPIDDKGYRRLIFNECVSEEFLKDEMWLAVFFGVFFSILLTIGIVSGGSLTGGSLVAWIAFIWGSLVGSPLLFAYGNAAYKCYPLLRFRCKLECIVACEGSDCLNRCDEAFWYMHQ